MESNDHCELVNKLSKNLYKKIAKLIMEESKEINDLEKVYNQELIHPILCSMGLNMVVIALRHAIDTKRYEKEDIVERFMHSLIEHL